MSAVNGKQIDLVANQLLRALQEISGNPDGGANPQSSLRVLGRARILQLLLDILDRDQALEFVLVVHDQQLLNPMLMQDSFGLQQRRADGYRDQVFLGHHLADGNLGAAFKAQVTIGENPNQFAILGNRHAGNPVAAHHFQGVGDFFVRRHRDRIDDHAALGALDLVDFAGLLLDGEVAVNDAETSLLCQGDCHARLGHGIHRRADDGNIQRNFLGQMGLRVHRCRHHIGLGRQQQHIIEGQRFGNRKLYHCGFSVIEMERNIDCRSGSPARQTA